MYKLPELPYAYDALEPYIEMEIMKLHHEKHQQAYVDGLNAALAKHPLLYEKTLLQLLQYLDSIPEDIKTAVRNHGGGVENHTFFWHTMSPHAQQEPVGKLAAAMKHFYPTFDAFKLSFSDAAKGCFGSGWAWLVYDAKTEHLRIMATPNQDTPISQGLIPLMGLDVWEHAYYLQYFNRRVDYITAWWHIVDWEKIEERYVQCLQ